MINSSINLAPQVEQYFCDVLLSTPTPTLVYTLGSEERVMPRNSGNQMVQSRYDRIRQLAIAPLSDTGALPPSVQIERTEVTAKVEIYGAYLEATEKIALQNEDPVLNKFSELLGINMRETEDKLMQDAILSSSSLYEFSGGINGDAPTSFSTSDMYKIGAQLESNNAYKITDSIQGELRFGTAPIYSAWLALGHTNLRPSLLSNQDFKPKWNYPNEQRTISSELGSHSDFRFFLSPVGAVDPFASAKGRDVYTISCIAMESTMRILQDGYSSHLIYRNPQLVDALGQKWTLGWTSAMSNVVVNDLWCINGRLTL